MKLIAARFRDADARLVAAAAAASGETVSDVVRSGAVQAAIERLLQRQREPIEPDPDLEPDQSCEIAR